MKIAKKKLIFPDAVLDLFQSAPNAASCNQFVVINFAIANYFRLQFSPKSFYSLIMKLVRLFLLFAFLLIPKFAYFLQKARKNEYHINSCR
jgi:hypothetical protein